MTDIPPTSFAELLDIGRNLVAQRRFDAEGVLELLDSLATAEIDARARGAIQHARITAIDVFGGNSHTAIARFALSRVVTLLDDDDLSILE